MFNLQRFRIIPCYFISFCFYYTSIIIIIKYLSNMKVFRKLFFNQLYLPAKQLADEYLSELKITNNQQLPRQYQPLLTITLQKCQNPHEFLIELMQRLRSASGHSAIIKYLTLIHNFVIQRQYRRDDVQDLQQFDMHAFNQEDKQNDKWFKDFCRSYLTYLMKLPSQSDIYGQIRKKQFDVQPKFHLVHICRLTNIVGVLFPGVANAVNVVGRYQASKHTAMKQLFLILSGQLVKVYSYIKYLCDQILKQYRVYKPDDLKCFIKILPELELLCDKIQDLLVNKYLKGKSIKLKIQFKEQKVAEVQYYLEYELKGQGQNIKQGILTKN